MSNVRIVPLEPITIKVWITGRRTKREDDDKKATTAKSDNNSGTADGEPWLEAAEQALATPNKVPA